MARPFPIGIHGAIPTFFDENEDLDLSSLARHVVPLAQAGVTPVLSGSMGEAPHLSPSERMDLVTTTRAALDKAGLASTAIISGIGASSVRECIKLACDAAEAGADYVLLPPSGYYVGAMSREALVKFYVDVAAHSSAGVVLYNFPNISAGIDMDAELICEVVKRAPNVVGAKLTCASVGKIARIAAVVHDNEFMARYPRSNGEKFHIIDGFIDILLPSISVGASGAISGLPNLAPKTCVRLWQLCQSEKTDLEEAKRLQSILSLADGYAATIGISGMKRILNARHGYGANPRRPLLAVEAAPRCDYIDALMLEELRIV